METIPNPKGLPIDSSGVPTPFETQAPTHVFGRKPYNTVEYPGPVPSIPAALRKLGQQADIDAVMNNATKVLELRFRPDERWSHPVIGECVGVQRLLMKVTRRRRRKVVQPEEGEEGGEDAMDVDEEDGVPRIPAHLKGKGRAGGLDQQPVDPAAGSSQAAVPDGERVDAGIYKAEIVGIVQKTVRFRGMADYQYLPNKESKIPKLIEALHNADPQAILDFRFSPVQNVYYVPIDPSDPATDPNPRIQRDSEIKYRSVLDVLPPPMFSRQVVPHNFNYQPNINSREVTIVDPITGEETRRLVNKERKAAIAMTAVKWDEREVPTGPAEEMKVWLDKLDEGILGRLKEKLAERPIWSRQALINQFDEKTCKLLEQKKAYFPASAFTYLDGPFRENIVRFGYDASSDPSSYKYQRIYFRSIRDDSGVRPPTRRKVDADYEGGGRGSKEYESGNARRLAAMAGVDAEIALVKAKGHIFDGVILHRDIANYQLVDVTDPLLVKLISDVRARKPDFDMTDGWYKKKQFAAIKSIIRRKWFALSEGQLCTDADCADLIRDYEDFDDVLDSVHEGEFEGTRKKAGRPKGGGGYAAGAVPRLASGIRDKTEKWKRKGVARLPLGEEEQTAMRLRKALEREQRQIRQATQRGDVVPLDDDDDDEGEYEDEEDEDDED